jgi:hypothetical protein
VRTEVGQRPAVKGNRAGLRPDKAAGRIEQGGLPGSIRADDPGDFSRGSGKGHVIEGGDSAKTDGDMLNVQ